MSSVRNAARLLRAFSADEPELGVTELARRLGLAKSSVSRLAATLASEGLVEQDPATRRYRLSINLFELGTLVPVSGELHQAATVPMDRLHFQTSGTVHVGVLEGAEVVYVERRESQSTLLTFGTVGHRNLAHATATGKALLAFLPPGEARARLEARPLVALTQNTITEVGRLLDQLEDARRRGYAEQAEESRIGVGSVAAPIRDATGNVVAAISLAMPIESLTEPARRRWAPATMEAARQIGERLGYRPR
jgi:IclR family transcriptional regulator, KDG regulon repressor